MLSSITLALLVVFLDSVSLFSRAEGSTGLHTRGSGVAQVARAGSGRPPQGTRPKRQAHECFVGFLTP